VSAAIEAEGLTRDFAGIQAISNVSLSVPGGGITAVIGPNGAGKTTLFNVLTNVYPAQAGRARFFGTDLRGRRPEAIAGLGLIRTFQTARVLPGMTVLENVLVGAHRRLRQGPVAQALRLPAARSEERRLRARGVRLLELVGLADQADLSATSLPGGHQKQLELARALMAEPRCLLLDEPAAGLNDAETAGLADLLGAIREVGVTILIVEHNMSLVMGIAEQVVVLDAGRVIADGPPEAVSRDAGVLEAYLGRPA
jgi:branched-chain amino acid transport system ATP-binding protein